MATNPNKKISDDVQQQILDAASERFTHYGYNKTTMAEIAKDCGMSAANLYRHFENKLDIGANLACDCLTTKLSISKDIVQQKQLLASERLRQIILGNLNYVYSQYSEKPHLNEMVIAICDERMDILEDTRQQEHTLLVELLEDGIEKGEFEVENLEETAQAITATTIIFNTPLSMPGYSYKQLISLAECVTKLILNGILK